MDLAADAVPAVLPHQPIALEGLDDKLVDFQRSKKMNPQALELLPAGSGWLMVQFGGDSRDEVDQAGQRLIDALAGTDHEPRHAFYDDPDRERELWTVRESGLGATAHVPGKPDTWPVWEDSAVPPERLGDYLRDLNALYVEFGYTQASLYGHFGQGCVHTRIPFALGNAGGVAQYRQFLDRAADLVVSYGGSLSGEHGDGQQRGEQLPKMFGADLIRAFGQFKAIFDPDNKMNPGKLVAPDRFDEHLRVGTGWAPTEPDRLHFSYPQDGGSARRSTPSPTPRGCGGSPPCSRAWKTGRSPCSRVRPCSSGSPATHRAAPANGAACCCGRIPSPTTSTPISGRPPCTSWNRRAGGSPSRTGRCAAG